MYHLPLPKANCGDGGLRICRLGILEVSPEVKGLLPPGKTPSRVPKPVRRSGDSGPTKTRGAGLPREKMGDCVCMGKAPDG